MDFTANEGSGQNPTGGSNPPVSALVMSPDIGNTPDLWSGVFCVPALPQSRCSDCQRNSWDRACNRAACRLSPAPACPPSVAS